MRYPALALLYVPLAAPALAHAEAVPHVHGQHWSFLAVTLVLASLIGLGLRSRLQGARIDAEGAPRTKD